MAEIKIKQKPVKINANMTPMQIRRKRITINGKIEKLAEQLKQLQDLCQHTNVEKKYGANTGNYDPSADSYWIDWKCPDCNKRWRTDQ
jgi:hypothetical protein